MKKRENIVEDTLHFILQVFLVVSFLLPFIFVVVRRPGLVFWNDVVGNMFAMIISLIAGIPIALFIDRWLK